MRVLFSTGSPLDYMAPPQLSVEQVNCGPDWLDGHAADGRIRSLKTPVGEYDLAAIARTLPSEQQPDVVVCLVDASWRNLPRNLAAMNCVKVVLVADTHHLTSPLVGMLRYLAAESFDRVVFLYGRHHMPVFRAAGFKNIFWFPGLTFPHDDATVRAARSQTRQTRVAFVGQTGKHHPRRAPLIATLTTNGVPVSTQTLPQRDTLSFYGSSLVGFNASLNSDLNLRVFEILASGAALLTDRLAPAAGLDQLFVGGKELTTYDGAAELVTRACDLLARPAEARAQGAAGARWFDEHFGSSQRREYFRRIVFDGVEPTLFAWPELEHKKNYFGGDTDRLLQSLIVYEEVQELHRTHETVRITLEPGGVSTDFAELCSTLPRVEVLDAAGGRAINLAVVNRERRGTFSILDADQVWCWDAPAAADEEFDARFTGAGFVRKSDDVALYIRATASSAQQGAPKAATREPIPMGRRLCLTFGGEVYDSTTALTLLLATKFGADDVWVYDDHWLVNQRADFYAQNRWLWEHHHKRGFGWYAWKPFILLDAFDQMVDGDVALFIDGDTFPIDNFSILYETCVRDGGIMLFKAGGNVNRRFKQRQWCKRDCFIVMNQDEQKYHDAEAGVARFMLFQKGPWRSRQFLTEWLTYCVNPRATTFDPSVLAAELPGFEEHRTEQAIMTNLAHKYNLRLYREACELGNAFPEDKDIYPQLFSQLNPWGNKTAPCVGSRFRNVT